MPRASVVFAQCDSLEYFLVREWQDRGVLHLKLLVRIARHEAPDADDPFRADGDGDGARTSWYLSKALNYVMKDVTRHGMGGRNQAW
ncbi:MAG TPA: hypothetical protein VL294_01410 [Pseudolysinimonas sp.]|jgi:hypothetical protein|nr:hypothetical protein [Pseudolysinimonas sp.]